MDPLPVYQPDPSDDPFPITVLIVQKQPRASPLHGDRLSCLLLSFFFPLNSNEARTGVRGPGAAVEAGLG